MERQKRRKIAPTFSEHLSTDEAKLKVINAYKDKADLKSEPSMYSLLTEPYKVCTLYNVLEDAVAKGLLEELKQQDFTFKENDLYTFSQTEDLNSCKAPAIKEVCSFLYSEMKELVEKATKTKFSSKVDLHGVRFTQHQHLLCHSDSLQGRHTAFILYLVPPWSRDMGGTLDLFSSNSSAEPTVPAQSLVPTFNSFSFFEVSDRSWHQVSEVLTEDVRWSLSGWFHTADTKPLAPVVSPLALGPPTVPVEGDIDLLKQWVNLRYLNVEVTSDAQVQFLEDSEIQLIDFLQPQMYSKLCEAVWALQYNHVGPADKRCYQQAMLGGEGPSVSLVREFLTLLKSDSMAILLSHITGLSMSANYEEAKPNGTEYGILQCSVQQWKAGSYTLLKDGDVQGLPDRLQLFYHLNLPEGYSDEHGGYISFLSKGDVEPLLVIPPQNNCMCLAYTRSEEVGFTKFVNSKVTSPFYVISMLSQPIHEDDDESDGEGNLGAMEGWDVRYLDEGEQPDEDEEEDD